MQKDDSVPSAGTKADSNSADQDMQSSSNDTKPIVVGLPSLSDDELSRLFDEKYGRLDNSTVLSHQEYLEHRKWQLESGFFAFRLAQSSGL